MYRESDALTYLKADPNDQGFNDAFILGWIPPKIASMISLWRERMLCDPEENLELLMDHIVRVSTGGQLMVCLESFFACTAENFMHESSVVKKRELLESAVILEEQALALRKIAGGL